MDKNIKNILSLMFAIIAFGACGYYMYTAFFGPIGGGGSKEAASKKKATNEIVTINPKIDEDTYQRIDSLKDYGRPTLQGIGKSNIFSSISSGDYQPIIDTSQNDSEEGEIVCSYTFRVSDGAMTLPQECDSIADGRTIKKGEGN